MSNTQPFSAPRNRLSHWPRRIGYLLMAAAMLFAVAWRRGLLDGIDRLYAVGPALLVGGVGVVLVFTDLLVRALYSQVDVAKAAEGGTPPAASTLDDHKI